MYLRTVSQSCYMLYCRWLSNSGDNNHTFNSLICQFLSLLSASYQKLLYIFLGTPLSFCHCSFFFLSWSDASQKDCIIIFCVGWRLQVFSCYASVTLLVLIPCCHSPVFILKNYLFLIFGVSGCPGLCHILKPDKLNLCYFAIFANSIFFLSQKMVLRRANVTAGFFFFDNHLSEPAPIMVPIFFICQN